METWLMQTQSLCIVLLMLAGIVARRRRQLHVKLMSIAMIWDIILILQVELSRSAILKASNAITNPLILNVHVSFAVATVILYGFMVHSGKKMLANEPGIRKKHRILGYTTFLLRILTFITSFWAVAPKG
ncbi:MAG: hypothetical protein NDI69_16885 [Bacteriovoracaceae bacterium]|nr:hypothetical protein [Bacteriovoracaceae bacterium]